MARRIIIIDSSKSMRRIIHSLIQSTVDDAIVSEADNVQEAIAFLRDNYYHIVLFSKESSTQDWLEFVKDQSTKTGRQSTQFVLFTSNKNEAYISEAATYGVKEHLLIPCNANQMEQLITRICSPSFMRMNRRYSHSDANLLIFQKNISIDVGLLNFSSGGMLCELEVMPSFDLTVPFMATIAFDADGEMLEATNLYSTMSRLMVVETNPDFSPKRIRLACRFVVVPDETKNMLMKMFDHIEADEESLAIEG